MEIKTALPKGLLPSIPLLSDLREQIKVDPVPVAILWVEMTLRPYWIRRIEYIYWKICHILVPRRAKQMTVGLAQMKVWLWEEFLGTEQDKETFTTQCENPVINYYAVKWYLSRKKVYSLSDISLVYTGDLNEYYITLLHEALEQLNCVTTQVSKGLVKT